MASSRSTDRADVVIVGAGIIGLATARALLQARPATKMVIVEKEDRLAAHQSGHNSGVIHSGVYYRPGSLKARTVAAGRRALLELCDAENVPYDICGKVIVATRETERPRLEKLLQHARGGGVTAEMIGVERLRELEPHAAGIGGLSVESAGIVDFRGVCEAISRLLEVAGATVRFNTRVLSLTERHATVSVQTEGGDVEARVAVNCAGLHSDRLAQRLSNGSGADLRIVPFRGEYHTVAPRQANLVRSMIYPVPDPQFPFLGPHFTRTIDGGVHAGPNAVLALSREGYSWRDVDVADTLDLLRFRGFRRLARRHWKTGLGEVHRSLSRKAFVAELRRLVPAIGADDLTASPAGVRAQALDASGALVEDFVVRETVRVVDVLNAPSPAATASLEIGRMVAARVLERL